MNTHKIILGDCIAGMKTMPDGCIHTCITSPPYFGLRSYFLDGVVIKDNLSNEKKTEIVEELKRMGIYHIMD